MERKTNLVGNPPPLSITIPKLEDLPGPSKPWERAQLPTDVLLLTVADDEVLVSFSYLENAFKCYNKELGHVYFGEIGDGQKKVKVSLIRCSRGSTQVGASQNVVRTAIEILKPKAVFSVGHCGGLRKEKTKLGDVVISSKLSTYGENKIIDDRQQWCGNTISVSRNIGDLITTAADGWRAPLLDPEALKVEVHHDVEILSGPELTNSPRECEELLKRFPGATAIEEKGQGLYAAAFDREIEWVIVKGISHYADSSKANVEQWRHFATAMATSVAMHMLKEPDVLKNWPRYKGMNKNNLLEEHGSDSQGEQNLMGTENAPQSTEDESNASENMKLEAAVSEAVNETKRNNRISIFFIGQDRVGKTSLKKRILGKTFDDQEPSTVGIEVDIVEVDEKNKSEPWQSTGDKQRMVSQDHVNDVIGKATAKSIKQQDEAKSRQETQDQQHMVTDDHKNAAMGKDAAKTTNYSETSGGIEVDEKSRDTTASRQRKTTKLSVSEHVSNGNKTGEKIINKRNILIPELKKVIKENLANVDLYDDDDMTKVRLLLEDVAGQSLFYDIHSMFLRPQSLFVLVVGLDEELDGKAKPLFVNQTKKIKLEIENYLVETNLDYANRWISALHHVSLLSKRIDGANFVPPAAILVLTKPDSVTGTPDEIEQKIQKAKDTLLHSFTDYKCRPHLTETFVIDNTKSDDSQLPKLREKLFEISQKS